MTQTLPQLGNTVIIQGTIKEKNLEMKEITFTNKDGVQETRNAITGSVTIEVNETERNRVHNHIVSVFSFEADNKVYKGLKTTLEEHKKGDFVRVQASIEPNDFVNKENELNERNKLKGIFFSRIEKEEEQIPCAEAKVKVVVQDYLPVNNPDGTMKEVKVKCFTIGYNSQIIPIHNVVTTPELAQTLAGFYPQGMNSVGELSFDVNNYLEAKQAQSESTQTQGFGRQTKYVRTGGTFVNNYEIIGGMPPERHFTPEEMQTVTQMRNLALEEVKRKHVERKEKAKTQTQTPPQTNIAFGSTGAVTNNGNPFDSAIIKTDDLPF